MERANDVDLAQFRRWYSQSGTPELLISDAYDEQTHTYRLTVSQSTPPTADQMEKVNFTYSIENCAFMMPTAPNKCYSITVNC
ncbi:MAG: DUF3458 domain-containing protein [Haemophilus parainfluenzae]